MNKIVLATLSFAIGATAGFAVGYLITIEKDEETRVWADDLRNENRYVKLPGKDNQVDPAETESPKDDDPEQLLSKGPAHIAKPGKPGVNYSKVRKIVKENGYTDPEDIQGVVDAPENEETYEERLEREAIEESQAMSEYRKKNKGKIVPITSDEWNTDFPEVDYDHKDLYYFRTDDVLTDEDGNHVDEEEYIGVKPRQFGWMENSEEVIYIRNNPKETDFKVWKQQCASEDWWA